MQVAVVPQRAQRARRHALELAMALQREERVEDRAGRALEERLVAHVEELVDALELVVDRRPASVAAGCSRACRFCSRIVLTWRTSLAAR